MRSTALGFATEYAVALKERDGQTMTPQGIVHMAGVFLRFLTEDSAPDNTAPDDTTGQVDVTQADQAPVGPDQTPVQPDQAPVQPDQGPDASSVQPNVEPPPEAPPPPPAAPVPETPAPATDQPAAPSA